jgi:hypothetical protein
MKPFTLLPYVGADPISFDMTPEDISKLLGTPSRIVTNFLGEQDEERGKISIRYSKLDGKVVEVAFLPGTTLLFQGHSLFEEKDLVDFLMKHDMHPVEFLGFLVFFELGIATGGFHDQDDSQKAITVFRKGRWDEFRNKATPFVPHSGSGG